MPFLSPNNTAFKNAVKRIFRTGKSRQLNQVISNLENYQNGPTSVRLNQLLTSLYDWRDNSPFEFWSRGGKTHGVQLLVEIRDAAKANNWILSGQRADPAAFRFLKQFNTTLTRWQGYACADVVQFAGNLNPNLSKARQDHIIQHGGKNGRRTGVALQPRVQGGWDSNLTHIAFNNVTDKRSGECTSFGYAVADLLSERRRHGSYLRPRIEVVVYKRQTKIPLTKEDGSPKMVFDPRLNALRPGFKNQMISHVFCLVGRRSFDVGPGGAMPSSATWGNCAVVDPWLGSLGWKSVHTVKQYPYKGFLSNLFIVMDSYSDQNLMV